MPLDVHCPTGCRFRLPLSRSGSIVRCPQCKSTLRLPRSTGAELPSESLQTTYATFADSPHPTENSGTAGVENEVKPEVPATGAAGEFPLSPVEESSGSPPLLSVPTPNKLVKTQRLMAAEDEPIEPTAAAEPASAGPPFAWLASTPAAPESDLPLIEIQIDPDPVGRRPAGGEGSTRFIALCVGMLGLAMLAPIVANWLQTDSLGSHWELARWQVLQVGLGGLLLAYAVFLGQIADRAALWSVSTALLLFTCIHAALAMGTWLDNGSGPISHWLQVPAAIRAHTTLWSFIYTVFGAILSCLCGLQAYRWQQADYSTLAESGSFAETSNR